MEVNPSESAQERLCSVSRYSLVVKKVRLEKWLTVVYLTSYLFSSSYSLCCIMEKPLNMIQNRCLTLNCTPAAAQKAMQSTFSKKPRNEQNFICPNTALWHNQQLLSHFPPQHKKQMNWQVNCALRENYSSWVSGSLSYRVHARGTMSPSWRQ